MNDIASAAPEKKGNRKVFLVGGLAIVLVVAIATGLYVFMFSGKDAQVEQEKAAIEEIVSPPAYVEIPPLMINLNSTTGTGYLRLRLQLELGSQEDLPLAQAAMPRIVDKLQTYLRQLEADDLRGAAGTQKLQTELLGLVSSVDHHMTIKDILIQEMLVQ